MIPIPYAWHFTATKQGAVLKLVRCENCACEYGYYMGRQTQGSGTSLLFLDNRGANKRAVRQAKKRLKRALETDCDPVPCPECGWYQTPMIPVLRRAYHRWMFVLGALGIVAAVIGLVSTLVYLFNAANPPEPQTFLQLWLIAVGIGVMGMLLIAVRKVLSFFNDPNASDQEGRKTLGQSLAIRGEELEKVRQPLG